MYIVNLILFFIHLFYYDVKKLLKIPTNLSCLRILKSFYLFILERKKVIKIILIYLFTFYKVRSFLLPKPWILPYSSSGLLHVQGWDSSSRLHRPLLSAPDLYIVLSQEHSDFYDWYRNLLGNRHCRKYIMDFWKIKTFQAVYQTSRSVSICLIFCLSYSLSTLSSIIIDQASF